MENQTTSSKSIMINHGVILGVISILISVIVYALGKTYDQHWSVGVIGILAMITIIAMGIKKVKAGNGGFLTLGEGIKTGLGIALISGIIALVYNYIFMAMIEPEYFTTLAQIQEQKWIDQGLTDEQIEGAKVMMEKMSGPGMSSAIAIAFSLFLGFIISLITGAIMKEAKEE